MKVLVQNLRGVIARDNGLIKIISIFICSVPRSCGVAPLFACCMTL